MRVAATGVARGRRASAALVVGALLLAGCTDAPPKTESAPVVTEPAISAEQAAEIGDGEVTATEYEAAYRRYLGCMSKAGHEVIEKGKDRSVYDYAVADTALEADAACYAYEFQSVDIAWQIAHEDESLGMDRLRECLRENKIEPGSTGDEIYAQMEAAGISPGDCV